MRIVFCDSDGNQISHCEIPMEAADAMKEYAMIDEPSLPPVFYRHKVETDVIEYRAVGAVTHFSPGVIRLTCYAPMMTYRDISQIVRTREF